MIDQQNGQYYERPWALTSQALAGARTWWNASPPWYPPKPGPGQAMIPPRYGYRTTELTVDDVLNGVYSRLDSRSHAGDSTMTDFSGQTGGYESTMRPTGAGGGGIV